MTLPFYTIGHSNRSLEEFVALLQGTQVLQVVDVRKIPRSRANPQFNQETLPHRLAEAQISYDHNVELGGRRGRVGNVADGINGYWENKSFHNYADYALSAPFRAGLDLLIETGRRQPSAIMCSEAVWWRCHRRLIADNLLARGETVIHIMGHGRLEKARLTAGVVLHPDGTVSYPASAHHEQRP